MGGREVGYMFGQFKRIRDRFEGVLSGKGVEFGGSKIRPEATGYGVVYMMAAMLAEARDELDGKRCLVSGSGYVAQFCAEKLLQRGGKVITLSDSKGTISKEDGFSRDDLEWTMELENERGGRVAEAEDGIGVSYNEGKRPWEIDADLAFPCATQNELEEAGAKALVDNGIIAISEGANVPTTSEAIDAFRKAEILHALSKA